MALAIGKAIAGVPDQAAKIEAIRAMIGPIRFDEDQSGYYFVYQGTTNAAHRRTCRLLDRRRQRIQ